jgi:hypothetical protein
MFFLAAAAAEAVTPDQLEARIAEIQPYRDERWSKPPAIPVAEVRKAASGSVVSGVYSSEGGASRAWGAGVFDVPIGQLWSALNDETRQPGYTAIAYSELLSGQICRSGRHVLQYLPLPLVDDRWWIGILTAHSTLMRDSGGAVRELTWASSVDPAEVTSASGQKILSSAVPIAFTKGAWFLVAIDERNTWAEYWSSNNPGAGVPGYVQNALASKGVRDNFAAIRRFALEGKPICPIQ